MTINAGDPLSAPDQGVGGEAAFSFTDKRRIDPETGEAKPPVEPVETSGPLSIEDQVNEALAGMALPVDPASDELTAARVEAAEHLDALQRERAAFTNYRNRALRDQEAARARGIEDVLTGLLPVLDDIARARDAGELAGPMAAIADKLDESLAKFGVTRYGAVGETFDPTIHDALMHREDVEMSEQIIELVIEPGYLIGEKVARAARVGVVGPQG